MVRSMVYRGAALLVACLGAEASATDWPNWRGPNYDGSADATELPTTFDRETHVRWKATLPGPGASTPVIVGDRIFVTSVVLDAEWEGRGAPRRGQGFEEERGRLIALCYDRQTGEERWRRVMREGHPTRLHHRSNYASPSAVTDGERVVFFFGTGDLAAFDLDGEPIWQRNLQDDYGQFACQWTFSATPPLFEGRLFLPILQRDEPANGRGEEDAESFLLAMDPATGETLYRHVRPSDAVKESLESYATAIPHRNTDGDAELLIIGGDVITGHDPATGAERWRWGTWNPGHSEVWWRVVPSPVIGGGVALVCAPKRAPVYAVRLGGEGELGADVLAWKSSGQRNPVSSDVPTPLFYRGHFYVLSDVRGALSKVRPEDGEVVWTVEMPARTLWRASPTGADGKIWCMDHGGTVTILDAETGELVGEAPMGEEDEDFVRASIVVAHGELFIRTTASLFCVGKSRDV